mgnify:CR=1 FL=1
MKVLEIGSGVMKRPERTICIDKSPHGDPDIVRDVAKRGIPFEDNTFDKLYAMDVIEHIEEYEDLIFLINEIWRVLKPGGIFEFTTPMGLNGLKEHMTHHRCFSEESFKYLGDGLDTTMEHMRISDGIVARFSMVFDNSSSLHGLFSAIK